MRHVPVILLLLATACGKSEPADDGLQPPPLAAPDPASASATAAQVQALDGLRVGDELGDLRVQRVAGLERGMMPVVVSAKDGKLGRLDICLFSDKAPGPPVRTDKYALYVTSSMGKGDVGISNEVMMAAAEALAARIRKVEGKVPSPSGVTTYVTEKKP